MRFAMAGITGIKKKFPGMEYTYTHITHTYVHTYTCKERRSRREKSQDFSFFSFSFLSWPLVRPFPDAWRSEVEECSRLGNIACEND